nr:MAG TPA: hypothetical protein [Caudoviricetes sp.]
MIRNFRDFFPIIKIKYLGKRITLSEVFLLCSK